MLIFLQKRDWEREIKLCRDKKVLKDREKFKVKSDNYKKYPVKYWIYIIFFKWERESGLRYD